MEFTTKEFILYTILINAGVGFLIGLVPLVVGFTKKEKRLAFLGLVCCGLGGAVLGIILSLPLAAIFTWLILRASTRRLTDDGKQPDA